MSKLTDQISAIQAKHVTVEGNQLGLDNDTYAKTVGLSDLTVEQTAAVHAHDKAYIAGGVKAIGEHGVKVLKDNPEYAQVEGEFKVGNSTVKTAVERTSEVNIPVKKGEKPQSKEVVGYATARVTTKIGAELKNVRDSISEFAQREFK